MSVKYFHSASPLFYCSVVTRGAEERHLLRAAGDHQRLEEHVPPRPRPRHRHHLPVLPWIWAGGLWDPHVPVGSHLERRCAEMSGRWEEANKYCCFLHMFSKWGGDLRPDRIMNSNDIGLPLCLKLTSRIMAMKLPYLKIWNCSDKCLLILSHICVPEKRTLQTGKIINPN